MGCTLFWLKFGNTFAYFVVSNLLALLFNINIQTEYILIARPDCASWQARKIYSCIRKFLYTKYVLDDINEQGTSFLDSKHMHMMKSGAPPDKFGVLPRLFPIEFHGFTSRIDFQELSIFGSWSNLNVLETVWVPLMARREQHYYDLV